MQKPIIITFVSLLTILMPINSIASQLDLELTPPVTETDLDFNIDLPLEIKHEVDGQLLYSFEPDDYRLILKIFKNYTVLSEAHFILLEEIELLEYDAAMLLTALRKCNVVLTDVNDDREFIYQLREDDIEKAKKKERKQALKTILLTGGGIVVGTALGILIGIFII